MSGQRDPDPVTRPRVTDLNHLITCRICDGYLIDASTIDHCLHSFCRSCIVQYLRSHGCCPVCVTSGRARSPHAGHPTVVRLDKILQTLVYKMVPSLFDNEMKRRRDFYSQHPAIDSSDSGEFRGDPWSRTLHVLSEQQSVQLQVQLPVSRRGISHRLINGTARDHLADLRPSDRGPDLAEPDLGSASRDPGPIVCGSDRDPGPIVCGSDRDTGPIECSSGRDGDLIVPASRDTGRIECSSGRDGGLIVCGADGTPDRGLSSSQRFFLCAAATPLSSILKLLRLKLLAGRTENDDVELELLTSGKVAVKSHWTAADLVYILQINPVESIRLSCRLVHRNHSNYKCHTSSSVQTSSVPRIPRLLSENSSRKRAIEKPVHDTPVKRRRLSSSDHKRPSIADSSITPTVTKCLLKRSGSISVGSPLLAHSYRKSKLITASAGRLMLPFSSSTGMSITKSLAPPFSSPTVVSPTKSLKFEADRSSMHPCSDSVSRTVLRRVSSVDSVVSRRDGRLYPVTDSQMDLKRLVADSERVSFVTDKLQASGHTGKRSNTVGKAPIVVSTSHSTSVSSPPVVLKFWKTVANSKVLYTTTPSSMCNKANVSFSLERSSCTSSAKEQISNPKSEVITYSDVNSSLHNSSKNNESLKLTTASPNHTVNQNISRSEAICPSIVSNIHPLKHQKKNSARLHNIIYSLTRSRESQHSASSVVVPPTSIMPRDQNLIGTAERNTADGASATVFASGAISSSCETTCHRSTGEESNGVIASIYCSSGMERVSTTSSDEENLDNKKDLKENSFNQVSDAVTGPTDSSCIKSIPSTTVKSNDCSQHFSSSFGSSTVDGKYNLSLDIRKSSIISTSGSSSSCTSRTASSVIDSDSSTTVITGVDMETSRMLSPVLTSPSMVTSPSTSLILSKGSSQNVTSSSLRVVSQSHCLSSSLQTSPGCSVTNSATQTETAIIRCNDSVSSVETSSKYNTHHAGENGSSRSHQSGLNTPSKSYLQTAFLCDSGNRLCSQSESSQPKITAESSLVRTPSARGVVFAQTAVTPGTSCTESRSAACSRERQAEGVFRAKTEVLALSSTTSASSAIEKTTPCSSGDPRVVPHPVRSILRHGIECTSTLSEDTPKISCLSHEKDVSAIKRIMKNPAISNVVTTGNFASKRIGRELPIKIPKFPRRDYLPQQHCSNTGPNVKNIQASPAASSNGRIGLKSPRVTKVKSHCNSLTSANFHFPSSNCDVSISGVSNQESSAHPLDLSVRSQSKLHDNSCKSQLVKQISDRNSFCQNYSETGHTIGRSFRKSSMSSDVNSPALRVPDLSASTNYVRSHSSPHQSTGFLSPPNSLAPLSVFTDLASSAGDSSFSRLLANQQQQQLALLHYSSLMLSPSGFCPPASTGRLKKSSPVAGCPAPAVVSPPALTAVLSPPARTEARLKRIAQTNTQLHG